MTGSDDLKQLTNRYLATCETVYPVAVTKADIRLAGLIARSALSVVINAADALDPAFVHPTAVKWFERLTSLYIDETEMPGDVSRALRWASTAMIGLLNPNENNFSQHVQRDKG